MADLGHPKPTLVLAKLEIQVDEQLLEIQGRQLRLTEIAEEVERVKVDETDNDAKADALEEQVAKVKDQTSIEAQKLSINRNQLRLGAKQKRLRLLELDDEREQVLGDIEASKTHIARLEAEQAQQRARLKES